MGGRGQPGSPNHVLIVRAGGETERHAATSGLTLNTDDIIRVMTGTGAGWGDPLERPLERVKEDLKNGCITLEQKVLRRGVGSGDVGGEGAGRRAQGVKGRLRSG